MPESPLMTAQELGRAARACQAQRTGHAPKPATVVLRERSLVFTLHSARMPDEDAIAATPDGAARVQACHRQLFTTSVDSRRQKIKQITDVDVREAAAEIETTCGADIHAFTSGTMVQVFLVTEHGPSLVWRGTGTDGARLTGGLVP